MPVDPLQLAQLIEQHARTLRLWVRSRCASSEDVVQEAYCKLAVQEPPPDKPVAWLYRVCLNLAEKQRLSDTRRQRREQAWAQQKSSTTNTDDPSNLTEILAAVETLDAEQREILVARIWGKLSLEEVAEICGISTTTAFRRCNAALQTIREKLLPESEKRQ